MVNISADMGSFPADKAKFSANMGSFPATNVNFLVITQKFLRWWVGEWLGERVNKWCEWSECVCVCVEGGGCERVSEGGGGERRIVVVSE